MKGISSYFGEQHGRALRRSIGAALLLAGATAGAVHADGKWLDTQPQRWNNPGGWVPEAPKGANLDRCGAQERQPAADEESQVAAANWRLQNYWPMQSNGKLSVVIATSSYDGMCRPWDFNAFVFFDHKFAGTVSPVPMQSRFDGALRGAPAVLNDRRLQAEFTRYAPADPLCCPSLGATTVTYRVDGDPAMPFAVIDQVAAAPPAAPQTPAKLPSTGETNAAFPSALAAAAGAASLLIGAALRFGRRPLARLVRYR